MSTPPINTQLTPATGYLQKATTLLPPSLYSYTLSPNTTNQVNTAISINYDISGGTTNNAIQFYNETSGNNNGIEISDSYGNSIIGNLNGTDLDFSANNLFNFRSSQGISVNNNISCNDISCNDISCNQLNYTTLNPPININQTLSQVLTNGNSAGSNSINMNNQPISSINNISFNANSNNKISENGTNLQITTPNILNLDVGTSTNFINGINIQDLNGSSITSAGGDITLQTGGTGVLSLNSGDNIQATCGENFFVSTNPTTGTIQFNSPTPTYFNTATANTGDGVISVAEINRNNGIVSIISQSDSVSIQGTTGVDLNVSNGALNLTTSGAGISLNTDADVNITSTDNIILTSTANSISLTSSGATNITSNTGNIELIPINDGITESGIVRVNKNNSLLGDGFLTAGTININSGELGYNITPQLTITNLNATAGITNGVPSVSFYKNGRIVGNNDRIGGFYFNANDTTSTKREWARMEVVTRNVAVGNEDGSISFYASLNGVSTEFLRINGADGDNNFLRPLDMNGSSILSTSGNLSISASASTGAGTITLTPKPLGNLIFANLPTSAVGLPTGAVWNNLGVLNIAP